jgi:hypothetical protein
MIHLQWKTTTSPEGDAVSPAGDAVSPAGDLLASPNFGICDTTHKMIEQMTTFRAGTLRYLNQSDLITNVL